mgnify:CR=1 FL=1
MDQRHPGKEGSLGEDRTGFAKNDTQRGEASAHDAAITPFGLVKTRM